VEEALFMRSRDKRPDLVQVVIAAFRVVVSEEFLEALEADEVLKDI
jgi:hypothetical protein